MVDCQAAALNLETMLNLVLYRISAGGYTRGNASSRPSKTAQNKGKRDHGGRRSTQSPCPLQGVIVRNVHLRFVGRGGQSITGRLSRRV